MLACLKNGTIVSLRETIAGDACKLINYFSLLSDETKRRFGPHDFSLQTVEWLCSNINGNTFCFIAEENDTQQIIAYFIVRNGFLEHDAPRLSAYGLELDNQSDCTFAPSVADAWQGNGLGKMLFSYMLQALKDKGFRRIILWGGVEQNNEPAVKFYTAAGFKTAGIFEYYGFNYDMIKDIT